MLGANHLNMRRVFVVISRGFLGKAEIVRILLTQALRKTKIVSSSRLVTSRRASLKPTGGSLITASKSYWKDARSQSSMPMDK
jgi:hypothetical protein